MTRRGYRLRLIRFSTFFGAVLFADFAITVSLWLSGTGGPSKESQTNNEDRLEFSIVAFTFKKSVFDLFLFSLLRLLVCGFLLWKVENLMINELLINSEDYVINQLSDERLYSRRKQSLLVLIVILMLANTGYVVAKGGVILSDGSEHSFGRSSGPPLTYGICLITSSLFALIEVGLATVAFRHLNIGAFQKCVLGFSVNTNDKDAKYNGKDKEEKKQVPVSRVIGLAKPELNLIIPATLFLLVSTGSMVVAPRYFGEVIDAAVNREKEKINQDVWILLAIFLAGSIAGMFRSFFFVLAGERLVARLRQRLFGSIMKQEVAFFDVTRTGELTSRLSSDTQVLQDTVTSNLAMLVRYILLIVASLVFMFILSWKLTLVLLAVVPVVSIGAVVYGNYIKNLRKQFQDRLAEAGTVAEESISSIRTVRSFSNEEKSMLDYNEGIDKSYQVGKKSALAIGIFNGCVFSVIQSASVLVLWYGSTLVLKGELSAGLLTAFMLYMFNIAMAFAFISNLYGVFMQAVGASIRIFQLLDRVPSIPVAGGEQLLMFEGSIEFQDVSFRYPSRPDTEVLKCISFQVEPGTVVALVGPSGGGKSTIVGLIERFYSPLEGKICLGGYDLMDLDPKWFRRKVSMVGQEPVLFGCTIRDNIAYGKDASQEEIEDVGKKANAHEFIMNFEEGYSTLVGERGVRLSGGQKQRIAIARALLMNPTILLLDEATSALDAESEHLVQDAIDRAMVGRTVLVIAHRLSTVRNAHEVLVVDNGVIAESGTHDQLLSRDGVYKKLVLRQLQAGQANHL